MTEQGSSTGPRPGLVLAGVCAAIFVAYSPALEGGFVWDDHALIEGQPLVAELHGPSEYFTRMFWADPLSREKRDFYRPIVTISYALDWRLGGGKPGLFHLTNLLLHLVCAGLLFALARRAGAGVIAAGLATLLWGVFPRLSESVAWVSGRTDELATLGVLVALVVWSPEPAAWKRRLLGTIALVAGLFSKEVAAAGVLGIVAWEWIEHRRTQSPVSRPLRSLAPLAIGVVIYVALRGVTPRSELHFYELGWRRIVAVFEAVARYAFMVVDGFQPRLQIGYLGTPSMPIAVVGLLLTIVAGALLWRAWRTRPSPLAIAVAVASLVALGLVLHVLPFAVAIIAADRYLYLPLVGIALLAARLLDHARFALPARVIAAVLAIAYVAVTHQRSTEWTNELLLWRNAVAQGSPLNGLPEGNLADVLSARGIHGDALTMYERSLRKSMQAASDSDWKNTANVQITQLNMAVTLEKLGRYGEAAEKLDDLATRNPTWKKLLYARVMLELREMNLENAERELRHAEASTGADEVSRKLHGLLATTRDTLAQLPPDAANEAPEITAKRAELYDRIGAEFEATRAWGRVLEHPAAPEALARRAAGYFVFQSNPREARVAVQKLQKRVKPDDPELATFVAHVEEREQELAAAK